MLLSEQNFQTIDQDITTRSHAILATNLCKSVGEAPNKIDILTNLQLQVALG